MRATKAPLTLDVLTLEANLDDGTSIPSVGFSTCTGDYPNSNSPDATKIALFYDGKNLQSLTKGPNTDGYNNSHVDVLFRPFKNSGLFLPDAYEVQAKNYSLKSTQNPLSATIKIKQVPTDFVFLFLVPRNGISHFNLIGPNEIK